MSSSLMTIQSYDEPKKVSCDLSLKLQLLCIPCGHAITFGALGNRFSFMMDCSILQLRDHDL